MQKWSESISIQEIKRSFMKHLISIKNYIIEYRKYTLKSSHSFEFPFYTTTASVTSNETFDNNKDTHD